MKMGLEGKMTMMRLNNDYDDDYAAVGCGGGMVYLQIAKDFFKCKAI